MNDVTAAIHDVTAAMMVYQTNPMVLKTLSILPVNLHMAAGRVSENALFPKAENVSAKNL